MNERIKELIEQATMIEHGVDNGFDMVIFDKEKFAELIVRECVRCCEQVISDPVPQSVDTWLNGGEQCIQEIKEHFGLGMSVEDKKQLIKDLLGVQK
jgi:predicted nucleotidyltransferase